MGIPVIAIGVPTVVSMATVAYDCIEETLLGQGFSVGRNRYIPASDVQ